MSKIKPFLLTPIWDAVMSTGEMQTLAEHAESFITQAISGVNMPNAIEMEEVHIEYDDEYSVSHEYYSYRGVSGDSEHEVKHGYAALISQALRRSTLITIYSLFEHHMKKCKKLATQAPGYTKPKEDDGLNALKQIQIIHNIPAYDITKIDDLRLIRNLMTHNDGMIDSYSDDSQKKHAIASRRLRDEGVLHITSLEGRVVLNEMFLNYAVNTIKQYFYEIKIALDLHYKTHTVLPPSN
ncbi:TPA: hypothetical protein ACOVFI_000807 [Citrobacter braakii]|uniref:hypothetical protein n=1 Tax=Citrobacter braakii TaxID=57706 RepID=UPI001905F577|nr:hypothetical protein [Citrobacter braakii]MBJ9537529.1 hypothetical protein [Citrobacter braakii]MBJ9586453.1 hypothetical protein [Citrobacter braakii]